MLFESLLLCYERLQDGQPSTRQTPAQVTCAHCQRSLGSASAPSPVTPPHRSARGSRTSYRRSEERQHPMKTIFDGATCDSVMSSLAAPPQDHPAAAHLTALSENRQPPSSHTVFCRAPPMSVNVSPSAGRALCTCTTALEGVNRNISASDEGDYVHAFALERGCDPYSDRVVESAMPRANGVACSITRIHAGASLRSFAGDCASRLTIR